MTQRFSNMTDKTYKYFAFISYSHRDKDFAHELQRYLENYRLPIELCEKYPMARRDVNPLFRDEDNLAAGLLNHRIKSALLESRYLIVICSENSARPNSEGKHYVNDEAYYFISADPEENPRHIIPIIHNQSPELSAHDCLPPILKPLNILGIDTTKKGKERCFNDVVASMLNLDPRELWQHHGTACSSSPAAALPPTTSLPAAPPPVATAFNPFNALALACRDIFNYQRRSGRAEFWMGINGLFFANLFTFVLFCTLSIIWENRPEFVHYLVASGLLFLFVLFFSLLLNLSMTCRRLHDAGLSGWLQLVHIIFPVSCLILTILCCFRSKPEANQYGAPPTL